MSVNMGGPAFPAPNWYDNTPCGMNLRDYFAAKAMQSYLSFVANCDVSFSASYAEAATEAYNIADAKIAARETK